ncbi:MAG: hypothetical protein ACLRSW_10240 [Christensenellaceae bacterium]
MLGSSGILPPAVAAIGICSHMEQNKERRLYDKKYLKYAGKYKTHRPRDGHGCHSSGGADLAVYSRIDHLAAHCGREHSVAVCCRQSGGRCRLSPPHIAAFNTLCNLA